MPTKVEKKAGTPNLQKLLQPTEHHPRGRVQIGPDGQIVGPKNNIVRVKENVIKFQGREIGKEKINVSGGHVKDPANPIWRVGLSPAKFHKMVVTDQDRRERLGEKQGCTPELTIEEHDDYKKFKEWFDGSGLNISPMSDPDKDKAEINAANEAYAQPKKAEKKPAKKEEKGEE